MKAKEESKEKKLSPEEYKKMLDKHFASLPIKMEKDVAELREFIKDLPALQILATETCDIFLVDSENYKESDMKKNFIEIEYLTWLFLTNKKQKVFTGKEMKPEEFVQGPAYEKIDKIIKDLSVDTMFLSLSNKTTENEGLDEVKQFAKTYNLYVRNPGYEHHETETLKDLFDPFSSELKSLIGFDLSIVLGVIKYLDKNLILKIRKKIEISHKFKKKTQVLAEKLTKGEIKPTTDFHKHLLKAYEDKKMFEKYLISMAVASAWILMEEAFTVSPAEISKSLKINEKEVKKALSFFSLSFGEKEIGDSLPSRYDPLENKPIIKIGDDSFFIHLYSKLLWAIKTGFEEALRKSSSWDKYEKHRSSYLETETIDLLSKALKGLQQYLNLGYVTTDAKGNSVNTELDGLLIYDTILFIVEAKAGVISAAARRAAPSIEEDISEVITKAHSQAARALDYINSKDEVEFTVDGKTLKIRKNDYTRKTIINVSLEDTAGFLHRLEKLRAAGLLGEGAYPWALSLNDLRVVTELLSGAELVHYVGRKIKIPEFSKYVFPDEVDTLGFYIKRGLYFEDNLHKEADLATFTGMGEDIDSYFYFKQGQRETPFDKPEQHIPPEIKLIIKTLETTREHGFVEVICSILDGGDDSRKQLVDLVNNRIERNKKKVNFAAARFILEKKVFAVVSVNENDKERRLKILKDYLQASRVIHGSYAAGFVINGLKPEEISPAINFEPFSLSREEVFRAKSFFSHLKDIEVDPEKFP